MHVFKCTYARTRCCKKNFFCKPISYMHIWVWVESNVIVHRGQSTITATTIPLCYLLCITNAEHSILTVMHRLTSQELHNNPTPLELWPVIRPYYSLASYSQNSVCVCVGGGWSWVCICVGGCLCGCECVWVCVCVCV